MAYLLGAPRRMVEGGHDLKESMGWLVASRLVLERQRPLAAKSR